MEAKSKLFFTDYLSNVLRHENDHNILANDQISFVDIN